MSAKKYRKGRPDKTCVLISIERYICLQSLVYSMRQSRKPTERVRRLLQELKKLEIRDFIKG